MKRMTGAHFRKEYDYSETRFKRLVHSEQSGFPAKKIGRTWFVDIEKFEKWEEAQHINNTGG